MDINDLIADIATEDVVSYLETIADELDEDMTVLWVADDMDEVDIEDDEEDDDISDIPFDSYLLALEDAINEGADYEDTQASFDPDTPPSLDESENNYSDDDIEIDENDDNDFILTDEDIEDMFGVSPEDEEEYFKNVGAWYNWPENMYKEQ